MTSGTTRDAAYSAISDRPLLLIGHRHGSSWPPCPAFVDYLAAAASRLASWLSSVGSQRSSQAIERLRTP